MRLTSSPSPTKDDATPRKPIYNDANAAQPEPPPAGKRPLSSPAPVPRSISGIDTLNINTPRGSQDVDMQDLSEEGGQATTEQQPRKRMATGDGISAGSGSPFRESSASPPPRHSKPRPSSGQYAGSEKEMLFDARPKPLSKQLWTEDATPLSKSSVDRSNIASIHAQRSRAQGHQTRPKKTFPATAQALRNQQSPQGTTILGRNAAFQSLPTRDDNYDIIMQPETRPISQEQLVAEVKGIYAGLVMVEAKCIEVDNKQATLAQADPNSQPKLNNEQWQALIALHRTLLHEHHDFFLASQHPSASLALRRLASKYAMPARMWRHGIHSFLELLRHRLPASLDHMLAFIYLAYSMMALLYETVPAFEDTWIECLGDLGRYRMAIEDDDIRDREVWTGVARHWYSKASDKAPTTGRLYHHLAILARPNALQQLFYYSKSLCVAIPFTSARESILTLFEPVLNSDNAQGQYRLPPLDMAFVRAHGLLFTNKNLEKFEPTVIEFLGLLDNHIGRVTKKFKAQGHEIAISNCVAMMGFAARDNILTKEILPAKDSEAQMEVDTDENSLAMVSFRRAQALSNSTLEIVLKRIGDPNVLPFIHVTLVFMYTMARHQGAMACLQDSFPKQLLSIMLNTLLSSYKTHSVIEGDKFPLPEKEDVRPFPEDIAMRGMLWVEDYYPNDWFMNEKVGEEEKHQEMASMTDDRKERILWLACRLATLVDWIKYDSVSRRFSTSSTKTEPTVI
ncbi:hypothetical protein ONS95_004380 [Cadophora gregata]|uniref:uncharacterized protein n=1 Tax=Cadophora gregata TaxID=51156 RepID=UPI0026DB21AE|nr:uncharacterized protein ONS95_004380 [Cadophora gregata]KAK0105867.1 hypothetical protein ONS95_004380 [Cadophora gregata]